MIIDLQQNKDQMDISYVDENRQISIETITFDGSEIKASDGEVYIKSYHNFVECDSFDENRHPSLVSFFDNPIKQEKAWRFENHNLNYFLGYEIPKFLPHIYDKIKPVRIPKCYSIDIETDITDEYGYSNQTDVENAIRSISITNEALNTILFIVRNPNHQEITDVDMQVIQNVVTESLGHHAHLHEYNLKVKIFDTEVEMLTAFIEANYKYFHLIFGWNIFGYDLPYIFNRCNKLNIDYTRISPVRKTYEKRIDINQNESIKLKLPLHRIYIDYMVLFKESLVYNNLGKYSLDYIAEMILGLNKVSYSGNLRELYEKDYLRFVAYAFIDTILPMLIHHSVNLLNIDFFQSYYTGVPFNKIGQNAISDALIYRKLIQKGKFLLKSEFSKEAKRPYLGGYVKNPTTKVVEAVVGYDFNSLYPNSMITCGISPEAYIDTIKVDETGFPSDPIEIEKWNKYKKLGYCLAPTGSVYDITKDSLYTMIEEDLLAERKLYKSFMSDMYLRVKPTIEKQLNK